MGKSRSVTEPVNRLALRLRYLWRFKVLNRHIATRGMVHVARGAHVYCRRGLARMELGKDVWIGAGTNIRCHEGHMRIGDRVVFDWPARLQRDRLILEDAYARDLPR